MTDHIHEPYEPEREFERRSLRTVGVEAICECGQEQYKGRWRAPKTMTGLVLRGRWTDGV